MIDCPDITMRESLPEFLHGALDPALREQVQAHLDGCAACSAELGVMRQVRLLVSASSSGMAIDVERIVAAIPPYRRASELADQLSLSEGGGDIYALRVHAARSNATTGQTVRRGTSYFNASRLRLAAGFLLAAVGISTLSVRYRPSVSETPAAGVAVARTSPATAAATGITLVGVSELSDAHLEQLIGELDQLDAMPPTEPEPVTPVALEGGA